MYDCGVMFRSCWYVIANIRSFVAQVDTSDELSILMAEWWQEEPRASEILLSKSTSSVIKSFGNWLNVLVSHFEYSPHEG
jgi:hypothetical protein